MNTPLSQVRWFEKVHILVLASIPIALIYVYSRVAAIQPSLLGDEFIYKQQTLDFGPYSSSSNGDFGNYLFNTLYSGVSVCGPNFYSCTKMANVIFLLAGSFFVFITARLFLSKALSSFVFLLTILSPISAYASFFMPEMLYFTTISGFIYFMIRYLVREERKSPWLAGGFLGLAALTKPHAILVLPALVIFVLIGMLVFRNSKLGIDVLKILVTSAAIRFLGGFLLAGPRSLDIFADYLGPRESQGVIVESPSFGSRVEETLNVLSIIGTDQVFLHSMGFLLALGIPTLGSIGFIALTEPSQAQGRKLTGVFVLSTVVIIAILIIGFSSWVTASGDDHSGRLLARYYEWIYPFIIVLGFVGFTNLREKPSVPMWLKLATAGYVLLILPFYFSNFQILADLKISDTQYFGGVVGSLFTLYLPVIFGVALLVASLTWSAKTTSAVGITLSAALLLTMSVQVTGTNLDFRGGDNSSDMAGKFANDFIGEAAFGKDIIVIGPDRFNTTAAAFWIDHAGVQAIPTPIYTAADEELVSNPLNWVLALDGASYVGPAEVVVRGVGFSLSKVGDSDVFYPSRMSPNSSLNMKSGNTIENAWGVWLPLGEGQFESEISNFSGALVIGARVLDSERKSSHSIELSYGTSSLSREIQLSGDGSKSGQVVFELREANLSTFAIDLVGASTLSDIKGSFSFQNGNLLGIEYIRVLEGPSSE